MMDLCKKLEHYETPRWAVDAILKQEIMTDIVVDPCCGAGVLSESAKQSGYWVRPYDIHDWGYPNTVIADFLNKDKIDKRLGFSILMNPPFSKATDFVEKSFELGARKILCFQRFAWWESRRRRDFWKKYPPARIYVCGDRAECWRHDIPEDQRTSTTPTAHAWFVWERNSIPGTMLGHIWKDDVGGSHEL